MKKDHREKTVRGFIAIRDEDLMETPIPRASRVTVRMTSDKAGASLSLQAFNIMISIPLEDVKEIITLTERSGK